MEELLRESRAKGEFGVELFGDADPERNPGAPWAYEAAGFGFMTPEAMREFMELTPEERDEAAGLCSFKKARLWFRFFAPRPYLGLRTRQDELFAEFDAQGWQVKGGIDDITHDRADWEAAEVYGNWLWGGQSPSQRILARFAATGLYLILFKPEELPNFSEEERESLREKAKGIADSLFEGV